MKPLLRFRFWTVTLKFYSVNPSRNLNLGTFSCQKPECFSQIPNASNVLEKYCLMQDDKISYEKNLQKELISEFLTENYNFSEEQISPLLFINLPIQDLQDKNLVSSVSSIIDKLLSYLEPFPFNKNRVLSSDKQKKINVQSIRNAIETEYLAWKFQVDVQEINFILKRFELCISRFRSLENLRQNISLLEKVPEIEKKSVAEKIYHLNQRPFNLNNVINFQDKVVGIPWYVFPAYCPNLLKLSHESILFMVSILEELKFTEKQIQIGLPFLTSNFFSIIKKLNVMLGNEHLGKYRNEPEFLQLLSFTENELTNFSNSHEIDLKELIKFKEIFARKTKRVISKDTVLFLISQFYEVNRSKVMKTRCYYQFKYVSELQVNETLAFLKQCGFTSKEIEESLGIVFYSSALIAKTFDKIKNEEENLKRIGFGDDFTSELSFFEKGTKEKRKLLQLCLYYLEKPFHFSGDGIHFATERDSVM